MLWRKLFLFFCKYFFQLRIAFHELQSLFGFFIFLIILNQIVSGVMLSFSFIPESMFVFLSREEEICENFYIDDFLFLHERGVDFLIIFLYLHICRKIYDGIYTFEQEFA
jgi:quinol-cytochrome oxidoreductase complex cytochrome b subunit